MIHQSTICAISTAAGSGAIAVIRLSGAQAIEICDRVFVSPSNKKLREQPPNTIHFGELKNNERIIDEVLVSIFKAPHSYTGEDSVEVSCHGSQYIQQQVLQLFIRSGAELAQAGEFTQRAFMNGKMDLSQAEAVADLIASGSKASHKMAMQQMRGGFSSEIAKLRADLLQFISLIELELDFSEEEVEFADRIKLKSLIEKIQRLIKKLSDSFDLGNAIKNGIPVAIVGEPNVGKSTLLNLLLNEDRAIVSEIAGTTRDVIEDTITLEGITYRFIDTAGLRHTDDHVERLGIERTYQKITQAEIVILIVENELPLDTIQRIKKQDKKLILVVNKIDKHENKINESSDYQIIYISAKEQKNIEQLKNKLYELSGAASIEADGVTISNARHYQALEKSLEAINRVLNGLEIQISSDFLAMDIREILHYLGEITGEITNDEILGNIFKNFCIGK